ncbi:arsenic resistance protein [Sporobolomyces salmoneus]|uniref:arsenic resistance protein n=1 Tax=Sporobolomyces salmoneus TaxID=183962 RepID=UPI00317E7B62
MKFTRDKAPAEQTLGEEVAEVVEHPVQKTAEPKLKRLAILDQLLAVWIILAMGLGLIIGNFSSAAEVLEQVQFVDVSLPLALALIVMMVPILARVSPEALGKLFRQTGLWKHILFSFFANWIALPLLMWCLAWAFLPDKRDLREGLILVGLARCIAMVLVWVDLSDGDLDYCAVLVAFNSLLQIVLYAPLSIFYVHVLSIYPDRGERNVDYAVVAKSVAVFLGIPLGAAMLLRATFMLLRLKSFYQNKFLPAIAPLSLISLLFAIIIIFAGQGKQVVSSITSVLRLLPPLIIYFVLAFGLTLWGCKRLGTSYKRSTVHSFTNASNNFELAIAVAIASYGANSDQALAATVGPLVEVPVLVALAYLLIWYRKRTKWDLPEDEAPLNPSLLDHQTRKQQLRNALTLQSNRASNLLLNGPTSAPQQTPTRSQPLGIREESELKAQRWTLSVRLRDTRIATEREKSRVETLSEEVTRRRAVLNARRTNLSTARSLLTSLSSPSHPTSPSLPLSLNSLNSQITDLEETFSTLSDSLSKVRRILTLELLTTYSFKSIESPLPDPFIVHPSSNPTPSTPFPPSYTFATLPLPSLALLPTLLTQTLEALLVNLAHLTRLLALYEGISLPFVPLPNCYGPGKAGIKSSPGCTGWDGKASDRSSEQQDDAHEEELSETMCFPLGFGVEKAKSSRNGVELVGEKGADASERSSRGSRGGKDDASSDWTNDKPGSVVASKRYKLVLKGAIALAYDLGYICWARETRESTARVDGAAGWKVEDLEDLGQLILRAARSEGEKERIEREQRTKPPIVDDIDPFPSSFESTGSVATLQAPSEPHPPRPATFPLSFSSVTQHYLALAFPSSKSRVGGKKRRKNDNSTIGRGTALGESSFVDAGISTIRIGDDGEEGEEEDEDDEEWDLV